MFMFLFADSLNLQGMSQMGLEITNTRQNAPGSLKEGECWEQLGILWCLLGLLGEFYLHYILLGFMIFSGFSKSWIGQHLIVPGK